MNNCKDCKYWGLLPNGHDKEDYSPQIPTEGFKRCGHPTIEGPYGGKQDNGIDSYEEIGTGPLFGCIHWEAK